MAEAAQLLIVGGPNGSGKTTLALEYADELGLPYVGADAIAAKLNPFEPAAARITGAREFSRTIEDLIGRRGSFVCESTLSGLTKLADSWVLLYNGMTSLQDVAVGSGDQTSIRDTELFATYSALVGEPQ